MLDYPKPEQVGTVDERAIYPYWYFQSVTLAAGGVSLPAQYLLFEIKAGYDYVIEGIAASWRAAVRGADISPPPLLFLIQTGPNKAITEIPIQLNVMTTPGERPATNQSAQYITYVPIEHIFAYRDMLELRIQAQAGGDPSSVQILVFGRNVKRNYQGD